MDKAELNKLTVVKLRALLKKQGLSVAGRKDELIERLIENSGSSKSDAEETKTVSKRTSKKTSTAKKTKATVLEESSSSDDEDVPVKKKRSRSDSDTTINLQSPPKLSKVPNDKRGSSKKVDPLYKFARTSSVYEDSDFIYDCLLNQTNLAQNNNKFYKIQLLTQGGSYIVLIRYGRVGEDGILDTKVFPTLDSAKAHFKSKFKLKTANEWKVGIRDSFVAKKGKYTLLDMSDDDDDDKTIVKVNNSSSQVKSKLEKSVFELMKFIFDHDMFKSQMATYELDVDELPLGKISKEQVQKGYDILSKIQKVLDGKTKGSISELSGQFYTLIPHKFGRKTPTPINNQELLQSKFELCNVLADIEVAQNIMKTESTIEHPMDYRYKELNCTINPLDRDSIEFKYIKTYLDKTKNNSGNISIEEVYSMDRMAEKKRFDKFDHIENRKLLWHGTNVAVIVAILKTGLRIMPHSGGRVGRGIYFASLNQKSMQYVRCSNGYGFLFLAEVALGKQHIITRDNSSLRKAPNGYDSILAHGRIEPDSSLDVVHNYEGKDVIIPQGAPIDTKYSSSFLQSEYLVYDEGQVRLRYLVKIKYSGGGWF